MTSMTYFAPMALLFTMTVGQSDPVWTPGGKGSSVVESVIRILKESCLYRDDSDFLRRLAHVQSTDGLDYMTFREGYDGGLWQIDKDQFDRTIQESAKLSQEYNILFSKLGIDWGSLKWSDLLKPMHSGIAAALYMRLQQGSSALPQDIIGQANFWAQNFRPTKPPQEYVADATDFEKTCEHPAPLDIVYLVDTSKSVTDAQLTQVKSHIKAEISALAKESGLGLGSNGSRVAMITYSNRAILAFPFERSVDPQSLMASVDLAPRAGGSTNTTDAFLMAKGQVLFTSRAAAVKVVVLILDGKSDDADRAFKQSIPLKSQGVQIVAIGIGSDVDSHELDSLASVPVCQNTIRLQSYSDVSALRLKFRQRVCTEPLPLQPGEYTFPCTQNLLARLPTDGKAYNLRIKVSDGEADIITSYSSGNPTLGNNDFYHRLMAAQPIILKVKDTAPLTLKVRTDKPGQGRAGPRSCADNYTVSIDPDVKRREKCNNRYLDLLILVDAAILKDFQEAQRLVNVTSEFVNQFDVAPDKHRIGVATFDQSAHKVLWLSDSSSVPKVLTELRQLPTVSSQAQAGSNLAEALKWAREVGLATQHGARTSSTRTVLVITGGIVSGGNALAVQMEGRKLQSEGIRVAVVALGKTFDNVILSSIASSPVRVIKASTVTALTSSIDAMTNATCGAVKVTCVENGVVRECSPEDLINSQYSPIVVGDRNLTTNPCALPPVPGLPVITRFPHPYRKDRFLICDSKRQAYVVLCPLGELYNANDKECEAGPPTTTTTSTTTTTTTTRSTPSTMARATTMRATTMRQTPPTTQAPPPTTTAYLQSACSFNNIVKNDRLHEYPGDKNKYVNCSLIAGQGQILSCPRGQWWVQASLTCRFVCPIEDVGKGQIDCSVPNPCNGALVYYAHPLDPSKFIQCNSRREAFILSCPIGQKWKDILAACDIA